MPLSDITEPWKSFLSEIDAALKERVEFQCIGGFFITALFGLPRPTGDVDVLSIAPTSQRAYILALAGKGSPLHKKHRLSMSSADHHEYGKRILRLKQP